MKLLQDALRTIKENPLLQDALRTIKENPLLLLGVGLFTYGLFNFNSGTHCDTEGRMGFGIALFSKCTNPEVYYFYYDSTLILLVVGAILVTIGILKKVKR